MILWKKSLVQSFVVFSDVIPVNVQNISDLVFLADFY